MSARQPLLLLLALLLGLAGPAGAQDDHSLADVPLATTSLRADFLTVALDPETLAADEKLVERLNTMQSEVHFSLESHSYESVVEKLADWQGRDPLFARLTPYVYVAAESLGAELAPLATYSRRETGRSRRDGKKKFTYHSWFVVRQSDLRGADSPTTADILRYIEAGRDQSGARVCFGYHSRFSTSSYFVPALFFLENGVFSMPQATGSMLAIETREVKEEKEGQEPQPVGSSELVRRVASGEIDLAAVWDKKVESFCEGSVPEEDREDLRRCAVPPSAEDEPVDLVFIRLRTELPNDLLVRSDRPPVPERTRRKVTNAILLMDDIDIGDFDRWEELGQAGRARVALADLLRKARQVPATLTIDVRADPDSRPPVEAWQKEAVEEAIELSGTEFTVWEPDFHKQRDFEWTLRLTHDNALVLTSVPRSFGGAEEAAQSHIMSFRDRVDLTNRTTHFIATRMHRVRRVWPYWSRPTVIRDLPFSLPEKDTPLKIARIRWRDLEHNDYTADTLFESRVEDSMDTRLTLAAGQFPRREDGQIEDLDPMSNVWYRVLLEREVKESPVLEALTWAFLALLVLGAAAAVVDARRPLRRLFRRRQPAAPEGAADEAAAG